jgi:hypothetical protein
MRDQQGGGGEEEEVAGERMMAGTSTPFLTSRAVSNALRIKALMELKTRQQC